MGNKVRPTTDNTLLWCDIDDLSTEELVKGTDYNRVKADEIHFAWLDKNNEIIPLTEGRLNPVWRTLNYETGKYEDVRRHFEVYKVGEKECYLFLSASSRLDSNNIMKRNSRL